MNTDKKYQAILKKDTRVLFRIKGKNEYLMTNDNGTALDLLAVFLADAKGKIYSEETRLSFFLVNNPNISSQLEEMNCSFEELSPSYFRTNPVIDGLIGQSIGDAIGVPVEFLSRDTVRRIGVNEMLGNDCRLSFISRWGNLIPSGAWSDDTSMTIAAMSSIIRNHGEIDYDDIMKQFLLWWEEGKYSSLDFSFGLGNNISCALERYKQNIPPLECGGKGFRDNGNGALMRMFPFSMYCIYKGYNDEETLDFISKAASITHGHEINVLSCYIYTQLLYECFRTKNPDLAFSIAIRQKEQYYKTRFSSDAIQAHEILFEKIHDIDFDPDTIPESGYVVDSLMIAIYCILRGYDYEDAITMAVEFGYDTDTNAAIVGSIAGVIYGMEQIPERWLCALRKKDELVQIAKQYAECIS